MGRNINKTDNAWSDQALFVSCSWQILGLKLRLHFLTRKWLRLLMGCPSWCCCVSLLCVLSHKENILGEGSCSLSFPVIKDHHSFTSARCLMNPKALTQHAVVLLTRLHCERVRLSDTWKGKHVLNEFENKSFIHFKHSADECL